MRQQAVFSPPETAYEAKEYATPESPFRGADPDVGRGGGAGLVWRSLPVK